MHSPAHYMRQSITLVMCVAEMQKVSWPSREDTRRLTILCINVTIASALFLGTLSVILTEFIQIGLAPGNAWLLLGVIVLWLVAHFMPCVVVRL